MEEMLFLGNNILNSLFLQGIHPLYGDRQPTDLVSLADRKAKTC